MAEACDAAAGWYVVSVQAPNGSRFAATLTHLNGEKLDKFGLPDAAAAARAQASRVERVASVTLPATFRSSWSGVAKHGHTPHSRTSALIRL